jgi:hypothetical protein
VAVVAAASTLLACSLLFEISDDDAAGAADAGSNRDDAALDAGSLESPDSRGPSDAPDADAGLGVLRCRQTGRGPELVPAGDRLCIDSHEVTQAQYAVFVADKVDAASQISLCASNRSFRAAPTVDGGDYPIDGVEWCDAFAFCTWAGKALCGVFPGQPSEYDAGPGVDAGTRHGVASFEDRSTSEWMYACQGGDRAMNYPYGNDYDATACPLGLSPVGPNACEGGFAGLFDMTGNAREWVDSCRGDVCTVAGRGGCRDTTSQVPYELSGNYLTAGIGFRCCGLELPQP